MRMLELKIPPPVVALVVAVAMWGISGVMRFDMLLLPRVAGALAIAIAGAGIALSGARAFRRARTTTSPLKPDAASSLVTSGVFRYTRNPMYLGVCLVLVAWALFLSSAAAFLGPVVFVLYITRFQIMPEERVLARIFGAAFADYRIRTRRWV
jgi:protein-S-isoprenylcysteine O-methyltransferase Ste14